MRTLRISFTVDEGLAGSILADLGDRVQHVEYHVIEEVPYNKNRPKANGVDTNAPATTVSSVILDVFKDKLKHSRQDLITAISKAGYAEKSLESAFYKLRKDKKVKRVGYNSYTMGRE
jgi:hypothetical protein